MLIAEFNDPSTFLRDILTFRPECVCLCAGEIDLVEADDCGDVILAATLVEQTQDTFRCSWIRTDHHFQAYHRISVQFEIRNSLPPVRIGLRNFEWS